MEEEQPGASQEIGPWVSRLYRRAMRRIRRLLRPATAEEEAQAVRDRAAASRAERARAAQTAREVIRRLNAERGGGDSP